MRLAQENTESQPTDPASGCERPVGQAAWSKFIQAADGLRSRGDRVGAISFYHRAAELRPGHAEAFFKLASCHHDGGQLDEALAGYLAAAVLQPDLVEAHYNAGLIHQTLGRAPQAAACYGKALRIKPGFAHAHNNLGQLHLGCRQLDQALSCFRRAIQHKPDFAEPHFNMGEALRALKKDAQAITHYRAAVQLNPAMAEAWNNLGTVLKEGGDLEAATECYRRLVALRPDLAEGHYNLGSALKDAGNTDGAVESLNKALALRKNYPEAWNNLGLTHKIRGEYQRALECLTEAVRLKPDLAEAHWNRSFLHLLLGRFAEGFTDYEWRFALPRWKMIYPFRQTLPRWDGSRDANRKILVHDEQGLGDTLQFVRYLPMVKELCDRVILEVQQPLIELLRGLPGVDEIAARPDDAAQSLDADCHVPLMSLPGMFGAGVGAIPSVVPYLWADLSKTAYWKKRLGGSALKVGIVWAGRPQHQNDKNRSCRLEMFSGLARIETVRLFSFQKGPAAAQIKEAGLQGLVEDLDPELVDFTDTAAVAANMDLIITVDTSVAHLSGAMARPVWLLLPFIPDWRWMLDREDSPWYPTMRLFRQNRAGDWESVFQRVESALRDAAAGNHLTAAA
jgi:tetratricopeptide (TPR) repeat protein